MQVTTNKENKTNKLFYIIGVSLVILIWTIISIVKDNFLFPNLIDISKSFIDIVTNLNTYQMLIHTVYRIIVTIGISYLLSLIIILLYHIYKPSINIFKPVLTLMKSMPLIIITLFIWLVMPVYNGIYVVCIFMILPLIVEALISGLDSIDKEVSDYLLLDSPSYSLKSFFEVKIPLIKNNILMSLFQTLGLSFKVMIMSEYIFNIKNSIGKDLSSIKASLEMNYLLAWAILIIIIVSIIEYVLKRLKNKIN